MSPRLTVGAVTGDTELARALARAGHAISPIASPGDIETVDLVLLDVDDPEWVAGGVDQLAPFARRRQMFIHTALAQGVQLLDAVEISGAVVMAAHNIFGNYWVTSGADELAETVIGLLIAEIGGISLPVSDEQRLKILAATRLHAHQRTLRHDAFELLAATLEDAEAFEENFLTSAAGDLRPQSPTELERIYRGIEDPGTARLFADLERRHAEHNGAADNELWALSKTNSSED